MKVVLTNNVKSLGNIGEIVNVSEGYARNFLIPKRLAKLADEGNAKQMADYQKMLSKKVAEEKAAAEAVAKTLTGKVVTLVKKIGSNGRLFGSVTNGDIAKELDKDGISIERRMITIPVAIKTTGEFEVIAKLFTGVEATFKAKVEMDPKQAEEMKKKQEAAAKKKAAAAAAPKSEEGAEAESSEGEAEETSTEA